MGWLDGGAVLDETYREEIELAGGTRVRLRLVADEGPEPSGAPGPDEPDTVEFGAFRCFRTAPRARASGSLASPGSRATRTSRSPRSRWSTRCRETASADSSRCDCSLRRWSGAFGPFASWCWPRTTGSGADRRDVPPGPTDHQRQLSRRRGSAPRPRVRQRAPGGTSGRAHAHAALGGRRLAEDRSRGGATPLRRGGAAVADR